MVKTLDSKMKLRDPESGELETIEFEAVWQCIKKWDIGLPEDFIDGRQLYSGATGNHVVAILDALKDSKLKA